jgi:nitrogen fixation NifU-like protein
MEASGDMQDLYRELVLDHSRNPRHFGRLDDATHMADGINPLCGDKLRLYLRVDEQGLIEATSFEGSGCAISVASASLMTETVMGLAADEADACSTVVTNRLDASDPDTDLNTTFQNLRALDGVRAYPSRIKCATLAWLALRSALNNNTVPATTE